jgi:hypothetical protein
MKMKHMLSNWLRLTGAHYPEARRRYLLYLLALVILLYLANLSAELETIWIAVLTGLFAYVVTLIRNLHMETRLRSAVETVDRGAISTRQRFEGGNPLAVSHVKFVIRNRTSLPIIIREVRLKFNPVYHPALCPFRLKYFGQTHHTYVGDPEEMDGNYLPNKDQLDFLEQDGKYCDTPEAGEFHGVEPGCGVCYGMTAQTVVNILAQTRVVDCVLVVDYPTILGGRKVVAVSVSQQGLHFIQNLLGQVPSALERLAKNAPLTKQDRSANNDRNPSDDPQGYVATMG